MKKLLVVFGLGLLFASCEHQPNHNTDEITPDALKELQSGHVDTLLVVKTNKQNYMKYKYSYFKTDKNHTFVGSIYRYNDYDSILMLMFFIGFFVAIFFIMLIFY